MPSNRPERKCGTRPDVRGRLLRLAILLPAVALMVGLVVLAAYCRSLLDAATRGEQTTIGTFGFWLVVGGFLLTCGAVVLLQSVRLAGRVAGPEYRLRRALQRIRSGDVGFRVTLRRGDLLGGIAHDCNALIDWLNANPPAGVQTGSDVVDLALGTGSRAGHGVRP
ncbi:MAG: hypothetical protein JNK15_08175 [Planctomycetes bacterium]|nr:hypothetical protein [Planctomycetota bacterium]